MHTEPETLARIEAGLRTTAAFGREVTSVPGFTVAIAPGGAAGLAVAVPAPDLAEVDLEGALAQVERVFGRSGADPSIEYVEELHPMLASHAHVRGWRSTMRAPLMLLDRLPAEPTSSDPSVRFPTAAEGAELEAFLRAQGRAYGGGGGDDALAWLPILRAGLVEGRIVVAALAVDGVLVAGASVQLGAAVGELAGVWTLPEARRRGYALKVCRAVVGRVLTAELAFCWLSAAPDATALYERIGFRHVGTQRNLAGPVRDAPPAGSRGLDTALS